MAEASFILYEFKFQILDHSDAIWGSYRAFENDCYFENSLERAPYIIETAVTKCWNIAGALVNPKGVTSHS